MMMNLLLAAALTLVGPKGEHPVTAADLDALKKVELTISDHGKTARFRGVELAGLLALVGAPSGEALRGKQLTKIVIIEARDGYRAVFALAELDRAFTARRTLLADRRDGKPLSDEEGPYRIVVEGEKRMGRSVRQVSRIRVIDAQ